MHTRLRFRCGLRSHGRSGERSGGATATAALMRRRRAVTQAMLDALHPPRQIGRGQRRQAEKLFTFQTAKPSRWNLPLVVNGVMFPTSFNHHAIDA